MRNYINKIFQYKYFYDCLYITGIIFLLIIVFFGFFQDKITIQWDAKEVHLANLIFASQELKNGNFPFWTPYIFAGFPIVGDLQVGIFYPVNFALAYILGFSAKVLMLQLIMHYFLAGLSMYLLIRYLIKEKWIAFLSALSYMFCGFLVGHASHVGMQNAAAWLPLVLLLLLASLNKNSIVWSVLAGLAGGFLLLTGHFQTLLYIFFFLLLFFIFKFFLRFNN